MINGRFAGGHVTAVNSIFFEILSLRFIIDWSHGFARIINNA